MIKCQKHPKYKGNKKYTPYCRQCRKIFIECCNKKIAKGLRGGLLGVLRNPMQYKGLLRKVQLKDKNRVVVPGEMIFDADLDIPDCEVNKEEEQK